MKLKHWTFFVIVLGQSAAIDTSRAADEPRVRPILFVFSKTPNADVEKAIRSANLSYRTTQVEGLKNVLINYKGTPDALLRDLLAAEKYLGSWTPESPIPVWVENIIVVERDTELLVAFCERDNGFFVKRDMAIQETTNEAFVCFVDKKTFKAEVRITGKDLSAWKFRIYDSALPDGTRIMRTEYPKTSGMVNPLNPE